MACPYCSGGSWPSPCCSSARCAAAGPGEILTSRTVRDLVVGSDITLEDRGTHPLKGVQGSWQLFAVVNR
jgi:class 3 adenylate cyclase